jgi:hypothetical protein
MAVVRSHGIDIHLEVQHNSLNLLAMPYRFRESAPLPGASANLPAQIDRSQSLPFPSAPGRHQPGLPLQKDYHQQRIKINYDAK